MTGRHPAKQRTELTSGGFPECDGRVRGTVKLVLEHQLERGVDAGRGLARTLLAPWGGAGAVIDAYEASVRVATDLQLTVARALAVEPARSVAASCADLIRDVGATQVSSARWMLDV